jgi:hypothetical protein
VFIVVDLQTGSKRCTSFSFAFTTAIVYYAKSVEQQRLSGFDTLTVVETSVISAMLTAGTCVPYEWF